MNESEKTDWRNNQVSVEETNIRAQLALSTEPIAGAWDFIDGARVPRAVEFCRDSAYACAVSHMLFAIGDDGGSTSFDAAFAGEARELAPYLFAASLNCANANIRADVEAAERWRAKCHELNALVAGLMQEQSADERAMIASLPATVRAQRALNRATAAKAIFGADEVLTRERTIELGNDAITAKTAN